MSSCRSRFRAATTFQPMRRRSTVGWRTPTSPPCAVTPGVCGRAWRRNPAKSPTARICRSGRPGGDEDLFPQPSLAAAALAPEALLRPRPRALRTFIQPLQFRHNPSLLAAAAAPTNIVSFNKFDPEAGAFIVAPQPGPGSATYSYNRQASLQSLNQAWPAGTTGQNRAINEFPIRAIETKPVFQLVKASGLTPQPLWQGPAGSTNATNPTPTTWTTCVLIDPAGSGDVRPATAAEIAAKVDVGPNACSTYLYGPLSLFYSIKMTADEGAAFVQAQGPRRRRRFCRAGRHARQHQGNPVLDLVDFLLAARRRYAERISRQQGRSTEPARCAVEQLRHVHQLQSDG
jgi:hypothetical protein